LNGIDNVVGGSDSMTELIVYVSWGIRIIGYWILEYDRDQWHLVDCLSLGLLVWMRYGIIEDFLVYLNEWAEEL